MSLNNPSLVWCLKSFLIFSLLSGLRMHLWFLTPLARSECTFLGEALSLQQDLEAFCCFPQVHCIAHHHVSNLVIEPLPFWSSSSIVFNFCMVESASVITDLKSAETKSSVIFLGVAYNFRNLLVAFLEVRGYVFNIRHDACKLYFLLSNEFSNFFCCISKLVNRLLHSTEASLDFRSSCRVPKSRQRIDHIINRNHHALKFLCNRISVFLDLVGDVLT